MVMAVEIFAGCARLSGAMIEQSVSLFVPIDKNNGPWADVSNPCVAAVLLFALEEGLFWYIHLGTECKMWSNARTRSSSACSLDVVSFTTAVLRGIKRCINRGHQVWFSIENPMSSKLFDVTCVKQLLDELSAIAVRYECCAWGATFQRHPSCAQISNRLLVWASGARTVGCKCSPPRPRFGIFDVVCSGLTFGIPFHLCV